MTQPTEPRERDDDGVVAFVVITDIQAHRELMDLCAKWHRGKKSGMYIEDEQSLYSYRKDSR